VEMRYVFSQTCFRASVVELDFDYGLFQHLKLLLKEAGSQGKGGQIVVQHTSEPLTVKLWIFARNVF